MNMNQSSATLEKTTLTKPACAVAPAEWRASGRAPSPMRRWRRAVPIPVALVLAMLGVQVAGAQTVLINGDDQAGTLLANTQNTPAKKAAAIPWDQVGAKAGADYHGEGLSVAATGAGARLHCAFQRLDGEATGEGLWLVSTVTNQPGNPSSVAALRRVDRFRVVARAVGRQEAAGTSNIQPPTSNIQLSRTGKVSVAGESVRLTRAGLVEEYSVSMDGVRQDFVVTEKPAGDGPLEVQLAVSGARVEPAADGAQLVLEKSGRKIAYSRLRATDATGKELPARIEVQKPSAFALSVVVNDAAAVYPVRIDPTFSDANWISMGGIPSVDDYVFAAVVDGSGNLYIGGEFTLADNTIANHIAKWNGSSWWALGSGMNSNVLALAVSGSDLYAGGYFTNAGGSAANYIAKWDGSSWSRLGSGMNEPVYALAASGNTLYAGGDFTSAGGNGADYIAKWDGSSWSALGSGMNSRVLVLAVSGNTLYAGGHFTVAGAKESEYLARASLLTPAAVSVLRSGANIIFTWPTNATGVTLQSTTNLTSPVVWTTNAPAPVVVNGQNTVTIPIFGTHQFFRLSQ